MFTLAHLSDPHISPLPPVSLRELSSKRLLGYLSWIRRRRRIHRREILDAMASDIRTQTPDHVAITGDLTNISLAREFEQAAAWLRDLGAPDSITVVPGNHDAYVALPWSESLGHWADYMASDGERGPGGAADFPLLRRRGDIALIGLSTALPTPPAFATGKAGAEQIGALEALLGRLGAEGLFRCVLLHHPPVAAATGWRKRLVDAPALCAAIARSGAELVLHGHDHGFSAGRIDGPQGPIPVRGVPSASAAPGHGRPGAHYQLYTIAMAGNGWRLEVQTRAYCPEAGNFIAVETQEITMPWRSE